MSRYKKMHTSKTVVVPVKMPEEWRDRLDQKAIDKSSEAKTVTRSSLIQDAVQKAHRLPKIKR